MSGKHQTKSNKGLGIGITIAVILLVLGGGGVWYQHQQTHFRPGTTLDGVDVSNLTLKDANAKIKKGIKAPSFTLKNGKTTVLQQVMVEKPSKAPGKVLKQTMDQQPLFGDGKKVHVSLYSKKQKEQAWNAQKNEVLQTIYMYNKEQTQPRDARIIVQDGQVSYQKPVQGNYLNLMTNFDKMSQAIEKNDQNQVVVQASKAKPWDGKKTLANVKALYQKDLTYQVKDFKETKAIKDVFPNVTFGKQGSQASLSEAQKFVHSVEVKHSAGAQDKVEYQTVHDGKQKFDNTQGTYGWQLNVPKEANYLKQQVLDQHQISVKAVNFLNGKQDANNVSKQMHVEIDLTKEKLYLVDKDGKTTFQTLVNTGTTRENIKTPTGIYYVKYKVAPITMKGTSNDGSHYSSYVPQAADITDDGIFIHSAPWVPALVFGNPSLRQMNGSNGCINVAPGPMSTLYNKLQNGTPVVIYGQG